MYFVKSANWRVAPFTDFLTLGAVIFGNFIYLLTFTIVAKELCPGT